DFTNSPPPSGGRADPRVVPYPLRLRRGPIRSASRRSEPPPSLLHQSLPLGTGPDRPPPAPGRGATRSRTNPSISTINHSSKLSPPACREGRGNLDVTDGTFSTKGLATPTRGGP